MSSQSFFAGLACGAFVFGACAAVAGPTFTNERGGTVSYYGQFNPAYVSVDDGTSTTDNVADSDLSNSRVGIRISEPYGDTMIGFRGEVALGFALTSEYDQLGRKSGAGSWERTDIRFIDFTFEGSWGKLYLGQGSMFADGAAEISLGEASGLIYQYTGDANGFFQFRDSAGALSGIRVEDTFGTFDGARRTRVRYDTPELNGFTLGAAYGTNELSSDDDDTYADIGVYYDQEIANTQVSAGLAYQYRDRDAGGETTSWVASGGVLLNNGLGFAAGYGTRDDSRDGRSDPSWAYIQATYDANFWKAGTTGFGVDYYSGSDFETDGSDSAAWGIGVIQNIDDYGIEVYLSYREHSFEEPGTDYADLKSVLFGARWRF
ncbi:MAG: porin [Pseudomonadota bacterium]